MSVEIKEALTKKEIREYIKFAWQIYTTDLELKKNWVPHIISDYEKTLDKTRYPLWEHADRACFTAWKNGKMVGTITAVTNQLHNEVHEDNIGFWGFFECVNDQEVANALFDAAKGWLKSKGKDAMRGPISPSQNDQLGMLSKGYDSPPVFLMTYNPPYYHTLCKNYGLENVQELVAFKILQNTIDRPRLKRLTDSLTARYKVKLRKVNLKNWREEAVIVRKLYNAAWEKNWGFVPMTENEFYALVEDLRKIADPDFIYILENEKREPIGVSIALPDINVALKHVNGNPMTPWGIIKFLWYSRKINMVRTIIMGVVPEYRNKGLDSIFHNAAIENGLQKGIVGSELSWVLKSNVQMMKLAETIGGEAYKEYIIYQKQI
ncbi:MAG: GNAT family N-acetyltransferase [Chloroherpetonaceae bacterium]|nr:GNAT family N-acetyltransferase [Chloroherpetonaceae bacterium]